MAVIARQFTLETPEHWVSSIVNGDESSFDYYADDSDYEAYKAFCEQEIPPNAVIEVGDNAYFNPWHDAKPYGVLPCIVVDLLVTVFDS